MHYPEDQYKKSWIGNGLLDFMKKNIILLIIINCLHQSIAAQNKIVDSMINWVNTTNKVDSQYILTLHRISYRQSEKDIKQSFAYYEHVSYYSDSLNFVFGKALAQINLGILLNISANFDASNKAFFKAIDYAESCGALRLKAVSLNNVGENFLTLKDYAKSRQYTKEAIDINNKLKAWRGVAINYEQLQHCDLEEQLYNSAKRNLEIGMPFAILANDSYVLSQFYLGFAKLHAIYNQNDSAVIYFKKAIDEARQQSDLKNVYNVFLAEVQYLKSIQPDEKLQLLKRATQIARQTGNLEGVANAAEQMSIAYDAKNNKDSSLFYYRIYRKAADSFFSENNRRNVVIKESEWMIKRKEIENTHLKEFTQLQSKELAIKNYLLLAAFIFLLLAIAFAFIIHKSRENKKKRTESQLNQKIAETQMQVLRAQMNPHFIFNSLNSIDAFIQSNDKYNATFYLNKFAKLIRNILDSSKQNVVSFSSDIETLKLYITLEELRSENKFITKLEIDKELMNSDYKVPPLIVQPFVENAIIHGLRNKETNDGILTINIVKMNDQIVYTITDNGIGRRAAGKINTGKEVSYGMQLSYDRVKLFNKEDNVSVTITDLYEHENATGTLLKVYLKII